MSATLQEFPDEILHLIILNLPFLAAIHFQQTCHKVNRLTGPIAWRHLCQTHFRYWSPGWKLSQKVTSPPGEIDWKSVFRTRFQFSRRVDRAIDDILAHQQGRTQKVESIVRLGWDAKDALLRHCESTNADDMLARQWYAKAVLRCLHRSIAIERWASLGLASTPEESVSLEISLSSFDLFVSSDLDAGADNVSVTLDRLQSNILEECPGFSVIDLLAKATYIASYLRRHGLIGVKGDIDARYHDLQNNFIGHALAHAPHSSLPLVSVAIYCSLAQRLGIDARPCGFPFHVLAIIQSPEHDTIFMDPFRSDVEMKESYLTSQLASMGAPRKEWPRLLQAATIPEIVTRCARNIITSIEALPAGRRISANAPQLEAALHAALWVLLIRGSAQREWMPEYATYLRVILQNVQNSFPMDWLTTEVLDIWLMQQYYLPEFEVFQPGVQVLLSRIRSSIDDPKVPKPRISGRTDQVLYKIGQVFRHKRYHYHAVVIGWDLTCSATEQWIAHMGVDTLPKGRNQSFYHVLVEDRSTRYVAGENIELIEQELTPDFSAAAGQFFKRWDASTTAFVSNIKEEYPDD